MLEPIWRFRCVKIAFITLSVLFSDFAKSEERADSVLMQYLRSQELQAYKADDIRVFTNGTDKFEAMFADMQRAKKSIDIEYFIFANDSIANLTLAEMRAAVKRGVKVRLIFDGYKDHERGYGYVGARLDSLNNEGIETYVFDPWKRPYLAHVCRDHKKLVIIDNEIGYIGGLNVADYYINGKPEIYGGWRDTHVRIVGEAARGMTYLFEKSLKMIETGIYKQPLHPKLSPQGRGLGGRAVVFFERSRENHQKKRETQNAIIAAFKSAKDTLRIVSPYFLPTYKVRKALIDAVDRGVHVEVLFSKVGDMPILSVGNYHFAKKMMKHGAEIFLYEGAFHHSKIMMVDGQYSMIGSANLNSRSLKWDYEASCFVFDEETTSELNRIFEDDKLNCEILTHQYYKKIPLRKRLFGWFVDCFFTPIL